MGFRPELPQHLRAVLERDDDVDRPLDPGEDGIVGPLGRTDRRHLEEAREPPRRPRRHRPAEQQA